MEEKNHHAGKKNTLLSAFIKLSTGLITHFKCKACEKREIPPHDAWEAFVPVSITRWNWKMSSLLLFYEGTFSLSRTTLLTEEKRNWRGI